MDLESRRPPWRLIFFLSPWGFSVLSLASCSFGVTAVSSCFIFFLGTRNSSSSSPSLSSWGSVWLKPSTTALSVHLLSDLSSPYWPQTSLDDPFSSYPPCPWAPSAPPHLRSCVKKHKHTKTQALIWWGGEPCKALICMRFMFIACVSWCWKEHSLIIQRHKHLLFLLVIPCFDLEVLHVT